MARVLLIGNASGRLTCLAWGLRYGNPITLKILTNYDNLHLSTCGEVEIGDTIDPEAVAAWAERQRAEDTIAVISDEASLAAGVTDRLLELGVPTVGPTHDLMIEKSKIAQRALCDRHGIDVNPRWRAFDAGEKYGGTGSHMFTWMETLGETVIKPDGLTGGKGVWVEGDHFTGITDGLNYCHQIMNDGGSLIIEEKLYGEEFSLMTAFDGTVAVDFPPVQDCKRAFEGDLGPNTGGMGSWACSHELLPWMTQDHLDQASMTNRLVLNALQQEVGAPYRGILYGNYIVQPGGLRLIEFNCRFGDPEIMNVIPLLETKFYTVAKAIATGTLTADMMRFRPGYTVVKYLVPKGYPQHPEPDVPVDLTNVVHHANLRIYHGSISKWLSTGSRTVAFVGIGDTMEAAEKTAETAAQQVPGFYHRDDIGTAGLLQQRLARFRTLMGE